MPPRTYGPTARVQAFLLALLSHATQQRYLRALSSFGEWSAAHCPEWPIWPEEKQDWPICEYVLDLYDEHGATEGPLRCARSPRME